MKINKKIGTRLLILAIFTIFLTTPNLITIYTSAGGGCGGGCGGGGHGGGGSGGGGSGGTLSDFEKQALLQAIDEEYYAKAVYQKVIDIFGSIQPFYRIRNQEQGHINMIKNLLISYNLPVPSDDWAGNINMEFPTKHYACEVGADAEYYNAEVYDTLLLGVDNEDIIWTFEHLRDVSRYNHLPSFLSWSDYYESIGE